MFPILIRGTRYRRLPIVVALLVIACAVVYHAETVLGVDPVAEALGFKPLFVLRQPYRIVTHMFVHGSFEHLFFNMLFLVLFGYHVEQVYGHRTTLFMYLVAGIVAVVTDTLFFWFANHSLKLNLIGASGAISGLLGMCMPFAGEMETVVLWNILPIRMSALGMIVIWFAAQLYFLAMIPFSYVAYAAHVGGFISGWIAAYLYDGGALYENNIYDEMELDGGLDQLLEIYGGQLPDLDWDRFTHEDGNVYLTVRAFNTKIKRDFKFRISFPREELDEYLRSHRASPYKRERRSRPQEET